MPRALIIVDIQNDFCSGGGLAVPDADTIIPRVNELRETLCPDLVVLTQDWHPVDHTSFIENNFGETLYKPRAAPDSDGSHQMMWPQHCVKGSVGADFHRDLKVLSSDRVVKKGTKADVDSYSGFGAEDKSKERTDLEKILRDAGITEVYVVGLAFDYCVAATAKDAAALGFKTTVIRNATRAVSDDTERTAGAEMCAAGVTILEAMVGLPRAVNALIQKEQRRGCGLWRRLRTLFC